MTTRPRFDKVVAHRLSFDLYCSPQDPLLSDVTYIRNFLIKASEILDMRIAVPPILVTFPIERSVLGEINDSGVTGFVLWIESHGAIHTWPEDGVIEVDFATCKAFDSEKIIKFVLESWKPLVYKLYTYPDGGVMQWQR